MRWWGGLRLWTELGGRVELEQVVLSWRPARQKGQGIRKDKNKAEYCKNFKTHKAPWQIKENEVSVTEEWQSKDRIWKDPSPEPEAERVEFTPSRLIA